MIVVLLVVLILVIILIAVLVLILLVVLVIHFLYLPIVCGVPQVYLAPKIRLYPLV